MYLPTAVARRAENNIPNKNRFYLLLFPIETHNFELIFQANVFVCRFFIITLSCCSIINYLEQSEKSDIIFFHVWWLLFVNMCSRWNNFNRV